MTLHLLVRLAALGIVVISGCAGVPYQAGTPISRPELARTLRENAGSMYPADVLVTHRAVLAVSGMEFVLSGIVRTRDDPAIRIAATADLGKTVFCASRWRDGSAVVERHLPSFRKSWLIAGPLRDAEAIYLRRPTRGASLEQRQQGVVSLVDSLSSGLQEEFRFDQASGRLVGYYLVRGSRCLYEVQYADYGLIPRWQCEVPRSITITDHLLDYHVLISVVTMESISVPDRPDGDRP